MIKVGSDKEYLTQWPGGETQALERMKVKFSERNLYQARNNNNRTNTGIRSKSYSRHFLVHSSACAFLKKFRRDPNRTML